MAIIVPIIVWNMAGQLEACIKAAREVLPNPHVLVVDGVYAKFPHDNLKPWSTDGTLDVARSLADTVVETSEPWESEIVKRNSYLIGDPGDLYVHLDADELLRGTWPVVTNDADLEFRRHEPRRAYLYRVFRHREGIHYAKRHHYLWDGDVLLNSLPRDVLPGVHVLHTIDQRPEMAFAKGAYRLHLAEIESQFYNLESKGVLVKESKVSQAEKTETIVFLAKTRVAYHGKFEVTRKGETARVTPAEAERLCSTFPQDFELLPKDGPVRAPGIPAPEKLNLKSPVFRNIKYTGDAPTVVAGKTVAPSEVIRVTQQLAAVLVKSKKWVPADQADVQTQKTAVPATSSATTTAPAPLTVFKIEPLKLKPLGNVETKTQAAPAKTARAPVPRK